MRAGRRGIYWREQDARKALAEVEKRCESDASFEWRTGIPASRLRWWRKRLSAEERGDSVAMHVLPVKVVGSGEAAAPLPCTFEVLIGRVLVRVPPSFDAEDLARLVRALESAC
jgi:hypothetical protein